MKEQLVEETELRRYLLGELTLEERVLVEERMFLDSAYMQLARAVKDGLVDEYAHQDLTPAEREQFESHFLARPEHRDDLRIAQALKRYLASEAASAEAATAPSVAVSPAASGGNARPFTKRVREFLSSLFGRRAILGLSFAAALIILSVITWLAVGSWRLQEIRPPLQAQDPTPPPPAQGPQQPPESAGAAPDNSRGPGGGEVAGGQDGVRPSTTPGGRPGGDPAGRQGGRQQGTPPPTGQTPTRVVAFVLLPGGGVRGGERGESVSVAADVGTVVLRLPLVDEGDYSHYRATLETRGRLARAFDRLPAEVDPELGSVVQVRVPADLLRGRRYQVKLTGITADGRTRNLPSYTFAVERR
ncbi:MAG: hypothetical protein ABW208_24165 [Pyrinomonadaceae bacterium]